MNNQFYTDTPQETNFVTPEEMALAEQAKNQQIVDQALSIQPQQQFQAPLAQAIPMAAPIVPQQPVSQPPQGAPAGFQKNPFTSKQEEEKAVSRSQELEQERERRLQDAKDSYDKANIYTREYANALQDAQVLHARTSMAPDLQAYDSKIKSMEEAKKKNDEALALRYNDYSQTVQDLNKEEIDPTRFWANTSTPMKILGAIGLALAGLGGPNSAAQAVGIVNSAIERDIESQKANLAKKTKQAELKRNVYGDLLEKFQSQEVADRAMAGLMLERAKMMMEGKIKNISNANARAEGLKALAMMSKEQGKFDLEVQKVLGDEAQNQLQRELRSTGEEKIRRVTSEDLGRLSKEDRPLAIVGFGGLASDRKSAADMREIYSNAKDADLLFSELYDLSKGIAAVKGKAPLTQEKDAIEKRVASLVGKLRVAITGPGVMSDSDRELIERVIDRPDEFVKLVKNTPLSIQDYRTIMGRKVRNDATFIGYTALPLEYENAINTAEKIRNKIRGY